MDSKLLWTSTGGSRDLLASMKFKSTFRRHPSSSVTFVRSTLLKLHNLATSLDRA